MKNHKYHFCLLFTIHFHLSDISPHFPRRLNFADGNFIDTLHRLYIAENAKIHEFGKR